MKNRETLDRALMGYRDDLANIARGLLAVAQLNKSLETRIEIEGAALLSVALGNINAILVDNFKQGK